MSTLCCDSEIGVNFSNPKRRDQGLGILQRNISGPFFDASERGFRAGHELRPPGKFVWRVRKRPKERQRKPVPEAGARPKKRDVIVEERTTVIPARRAVIMRREPVTLSRALGEAAVVESAAEPVTSTTVVRRKRA